MLDNAEALTNLEWRSLLDAGYASASINQDVSTQHDHSWHRTGEYRPTAEPIYFYHCACGWVGEAKEGNVITAKGYAPEIAQWCRDCKRTD